MCYVAAMTTTGLRELRQDASTLIRRAEAGERIIVTVSGRPVAEIGPLTASRRWRRGSEVAAIFSGATDEHWAEDFGGFDDTLRDPFEAIDLDEAGE